MAESISHGRARRRARGVRLALASIAFAAPVAGWRALGDAVPPAPRPPLTESEDLHWIAPGVGPAYLIGAAEPDDVLVVGDSRARGTIVTSRFPQSGPGPVSVLWAGGLDVVDALRGARELPSTRVVVAVSALGLSEMRNEAMEEILAERVPPYDLGATRRDVLRWSDDLRAGFGEGWTPAHDANVALLLRDHGTSRERSRQWTHAFDHRLRGLVELARVRALHPLYAGRWHTEWLRRPAPRTSDARYRTFLRRTTPAARERIVEEAIEIARALVDEGRRVAFVRLPCDRELRRIEDGIVPPSLVASIPESVGAPYLDLMAASPERAWRTGDGSHVFLDEAIDVTDTVARWLRDDLGW